MDSYDAVDAGLFVCDASVLAAAERALAAGEGTWNDVKRRCLAEGAEIVAVDLEGAFWLDVDTPDERARAERLLVQRAGGKAWDGAVSRWINRPLSRPISRVLIRTGMSPNAVTVLAFVIALAGAGAIAAGTVWPLALVAGGLLVQLASIVDGVDGEVARASLRESEAGEFLDSVLDRVADGAVVAALAVAAGGQTAWIVAAAALFGSLAVPFVKAAFHRSFGRPLPAPPSRVGAGRDLRLLLAALAAVTLMPFAGLVALALVTNLEAARRFAAGWRAARPPRPRPRRVPARDLPRPDAAAELTAAAAASRAMTARPPERR
jgi:CDP-L-myo-inositol myo-inositolphosphotransferase